MKKRKKKEKKTRYVRRRVFTPCDATSRQTTSFLVRNLKLRLEGEEKKKKKERKKKRKSVQMCHIN